MKVLSLFDGISCARVSLDRACIPVESYYASEIDKYVIQIAQNNYSDTKQVGSVVGLDCSQFKDIDLLIGGSPCQDLSIAKKNREGLAGSRSGLFWEYVRIRNEVKPKYFILENVASMPKEAKQIITDALGVEPVMIDAALVSAQRRKRLFWVGKWNGEKYEQVDIPQPEDRGIFLKDILEDVPKNDIPLKEKSKTISMVGRIVGRIAGWSDDGKTLRAFQGNKKKSTVAEHLYHYPNSKTTSITLVNVPKCANPIRKLTPTECERLQCVPDGYTEGVSNTQRYKSLGNAFNVDVVAHILLNIKK